MAVADPTTVDQVAAAPDGRLLLAMTETRRYAGSDLDALTEDFRQKLNAYVYLIRSGQLAEIVGQPVRGGVEIQLYCFDAPPPAVVEMIELADGALRAEGVAVGWTLHSAPDADRLLEIIRELLAEAAPPGWTRIDLSVSMVGDGVAGALVAQTAAGERVDLNPPGDLVQALAALKNATWEPERGAWITFQAVLVDGAIHPTYDLGEPPGGPAEFPDVRWAEELDRYPRSEPPTWWPTPA